MTTEAAEVTLRLNIPYLYTYWLRAMEPTTKFRDEAREWDKENTLLSGLRLNLLEAHRFLYQPDRPSFEAFEEWVLAINGGAIDEPSLTRLRDALDGKPVGSPAGNLDAVAGLTAGELAFWEEHGYVVLHDAVPPESRDAAAAAIYEFLDVDPANPETWYTEKAGKSIWVPLTHHPAFWANRHAPRLVKAFAQLWGREDLWPTVDQGGFNPPERPGWPFPGPHAHWDMTLLPPHVFGLQGILYLTDTEANQGAFTCIPGFHRKLESWLKALPPNVDPRHAILQEPGLTPVAAKAGDLVIWHHALPHGSSPNFNIRPRVAQYLFHRPTRWPYTPEWK
jgi:hypothetical protein